MLLTSIGTTVMTGARLKVFDPEKRPALSPRETEVAKLIALGNSTKDVATCLGISENTVVVHRNNLMNKLQIHNVVELVWWALRSGLVSL